MNIGTTTSSEPLAATCPPRRWSTHSIAAQIVEDVTAPGAPHRRALPIAGDDASAKRVATHFIDEIGFDVVDPGPLAQGRRLDPMAAWGPILDAEGLRRSLALG
jgi:predicted dinucleotide-binding enzyme